MEEADLFFVPSYVKCVRMMGGLNDKEINQTYVKVILPFLVWIGMYFSVMCIVANRGKD